MICGDHLLEPKPYRGERKKKNLPIWVECDRPAATMECLFAQMQRTVRLRHEARIYRFKSRYMPH